MPITSFIWLIINFVLTFWKVNNSHSFREYMSSKHQNINCSVEQEEVGSLLFLNDKICFKNDKFLTSFYRRPTIGGVFSSDESFISTYQARELSYTLLHRSLSICRQFKTYNLEIDQEKIIIFRTMLIRLLNHSLIICSRRTAVL